MYRYPGYPNSMIGDFEVVVHDDRIHLFHLLLDTHDLVGHLVSDDGLTWQELPVALRVGDPGEFDDDQIWTMGVFRRGGKFFMLYTGKKLSEWGRVERTGLAVSDDLIHWKKHHANPVAEADPRWYVAADTKDARIQWRDPHVIVEDDGTIHALVAAQEKDGPFNFSACVGHFTSTDGYRWEVRPPICRFRIGYDFEVPSVFTFNGKYYIVGLHGHAVQHVYRVADRLQGPWRRPADDRILGTGNYAYRPLVWGGKTYLMNWLRHGDADWMAGMRGGRVLVAPREVVAGEGESIYLRSFTGWDQRGVAAARRPQPNEFVASRLGTWGQWEAHGDALLGRSEIGYAFRLLPQVHDDFIAEVTIEPDEAREFGIVFRSDETVDLHTAAVCAPGYAQVSLARYTAVTYPPGNLRWRGCSVIGASHFEYPPGKPVRLRVVASGPYVEVSVNDRLLIAQLTMSRRRGHIGVFLADGAARFSKLSILPITPPQADLI